MLFVSAQRELRAFFLSGASPCRSRAACFSPPRARALIFPRSKKLADRVFFVFFAFFLNPSDSRSVLSCPLTFRSPNARCVSHGLTNAPTGFFSSFFFALFLFFFFFFFAFWERRSLLLCLISLHRAHSFSHGRTNSPTGLFFYFFFRFFFTPEPVQVTPELPVFFSRSVLLFPTLPETP